MSRFLPDGFLEEYARLGGPSPALRDFLEVYEAMCEVLYHGARIKEDAGKVTGGGAHEGYWFGDDTLLGVKSQVDRRLAQAASNLRSWAASRSRQGARRPAPQDPDRADLARARSQGPHGPIADSA